MLHRPTAQEALHDPWLTPIPIGTDTPSHVDLSPTLRQNWSPRAKWHSALTGIRAANRFSYFAAAAAAAASRTSTQSSGGWDDVIDQNPPVTQVLEEKDPSSGVVAQVPSKEEAKEEAKEEEAAKEEEDLGSDDIMPGSFEPAHREPSLPWTEVVGKNLDDFLTLLHVK